ncbi:MAG: hypothetical protein HOJ21_00900 [Alphaproteobacteria bacterium]|jgi:hypothetical protein|nr:hypothetical protein [Alphaproteobacteria bacterium]
MTTYTMRDPTAETAAVLRERRQPPESLVGKTVALLSISKERSDEFMDALEPHIKAAGVKTIRFKKPTHTKPAPEALLQDIVEQADLVIEALAD